MAASVRDVSLSKNPLFYPKKINLEVQNLLIQVPFHSASFVAWWKQADQSRDFWIETSEEFIRVHMVPRKGGFDPAKWSTSLNSLKSQLLGRLGDWRITEAIHCHGEGLVEESQYVKWRSHEVEGQGDDQHGALQQLWVGRSRFVKHGPKVESPVQTDAIAHVTMASEPCAVGGGAGGVRSGHSPEVDGAGTSADGDRAACRALPQGGEQADRPHEDELGRPDEAGQRGRPGDSRQADTWSSAERSDGCAGRSCDDLRQVQELDVSRGAGGLHGLGGEGVKKSQSELQPGLGDVRQLGQAGDDRPQRAGEEEGHLHPTRRPRSACNVGAARHGVREELEEQSVIGIDTQEGSKLCGGGASRDASGHQPGGQGRDGAVGDAVGGAEAEEQSRPGIASRFLKWMRGIKKSGEQVYFVNDEEDGGGLGESVVGAMNGGGGRCEGACNEVMMLELENEELFHCPAAGDLADRGSSDRRGILVRDGPAGPDRDQWSGAGDSVGGGDPHGPGRERSGGCGLPVHVGLPSPRHDPGPDGSGRSGVGDRVGGGDPRGPRREQVARYEAGGNISGNKSPALQERESRGRSDHDGRSSEDLDSHGRDQGRCDGVDGGDPHCPDRSGAGDSVGGGDPHGPGREQDGLTDDPRSPKKRAQEGNMRRKAERWAKRHPVKKKLYGMASQVRSVLLACAFVVGSIANETVLEPGRDLWSCFASSSHVGQDEQADCLELFAGHAEITGAFARARRGVLRPRDIKYGDDLRQSATHEDVCEDIERHRPKVVWIAPPCREYCAFSRLNHTKQERRRRRLKEKVFLELIDKVMVMQLAGGRDVVVENPLSSDIWREPLLERWAKDSRVHIFRTDLCQHGMLSADGKQPLRKPVRLMCTHPAFVEEMGKKCDGEHQHRTIQGKETEHSAHYPEGLGDAAVRAVKKIEAHQVCVAEAGGGNADDGQLVPALEVEGGEMEEWSPNRISFKGTMSGKAAGALRRLHQNLGHPTNRELIRHLRLGGANKELVDAAEKLQCQVCAKCSRPKTHRVAKPTALLDFNEAVAMDILFFDTMESTGHMGLNMVDVASSYQVVVPLENRKSETVAKAFYAHWVSWAGVPGRLVLDLDTAFADSFQDLTSQDGIAMRAAAGQAHWQNGVAERYGDSWKDIWKKVCNEHIVCDHEIWDAMGAVSDARNSLRNRAGFSPRQWVFGTNGRVVPDLEDGERNDLSAISAVTSDEKMSRKHMLKLGAKTAFFELQNVDSLKRALSHRTRVRPRDYKPGDMVYIYRDDPSGKKSKAKWIGPATVIGNEGSNVWAARGGRCILAASEHLRPAEHEEVSEMLRLKAALKEVEQVMDKEFEEVVEQDASGEQIPIQTEDMEVDGPGLQEIASSSMGPREDRRRKALETESKHKQVRKQAKLLDDVPISVKRKLVNTAHEFDHEEGEKQAFYVKKQLSEEATQKALDKELPWWMIPVEERELFREAEKKQWQEHLDYKAVKPLSLEESREVEKNVPKERILPARFLYRDKSRAKRRLDKGVECKAKARLCVGGQKDPDLGVVDMAVDAPTANRQSILIGLLVALSRGWLVAVGDVRAAFLNGIEAPRNLYFRQPIRGIPGLLPGQLIEIKKGVFGLSTSPKLWWLKLSSDVVGITFQHKGESFKIEQNEIDPCCFRVVSCSGGRIAGMFFTHVDDIMIMAEEGVFQAAKDELSKRFPVDEWEENQFEYVGCEYKVDGDEIFINQSVYTQTRVDRITIPSGLDDDEPAGPDLVNSHRSVVGCLSWLAKQTRPDLQFSVSQAQRVQGKPTIGDIKEVNKLVELARKHFQRGITLKKIPEDKLSVFAFHDAAWGNVAADDSKVLDPEWDGEFTMGSQLGSLVMVGHKDCLSNEEGACSFVDWKSKASTRVCRSTFAGETMACGDALESALYLRGLLASFLTGKIVEERAGGALVPIHLFTDCKSLYDHLHKDGVPRPPSEKRLAIELAAIRQTLAVEAQHQWFQRFGGGEARPDKPKKPPIHWLPTDQQWADLLTKKMSATTWWEAIGRGILKLPLSVPRESLERKDSVSV